MLKYVVCRKHIAHMETFCCKTTEREREWKKYMKLVYLNNILFNCFTSGKTFVNIIIEIQIKKSLPPSFFYLFNTSVLFTYKNVLFCLFNTFQFKCDWICTAIKNLILNILFNRFFRKFMIKRLLFIYFMFFVWFSKVHKSDSKSSSER